MPRVTPAGARRLLDGLYREALSGADPDGAVRRALARPEFERAVGGARRVGIFAAGKAAAGMTRGALEGLGRRDALVVLPRGYASTGLSEAETLFAGHPEPDASSVRAARRALRFFEGFGPRDLVLCLLSGGASSLVALPRPGIPLPAKRRAVRRLSETGAGILALNRLRTSLSAIKGGRLGRATRARLATLVLSDVPGRRASAVGSGPTIRGRSGDLVRIVGDNRSGLAAAARRAAELGLTVVLERRRLSGQARAAGRRLARVLASLRPGTVLLAGGETTVTLDRGHGRGGRSLELALAAAIELAGMRGAALLAAGSDGRDGSADAAGAFADGATVARARRRELDPAGALARHDTFPFFRGLSDLLVTGPTGTNVGDWVFGLRHREPGRVRPV
jgi:glycerate 2-kinase